jgi:hypothetical protein
VSLLFSWIIANIAKSFSSSFVVMIVIITRTKYKSL